MDENLIKAAPKLLEACRIMLRMWHQEEPIRDRQEREALEALTDAISAAEGRLGDDDREAIQEGDYRYYNR